MKAKEILKQYYGSDVDAVEVTIDELEKFAERYAKERVIEELVSLERFINSSAYIFDIAAFTNNRIEKLKNENK
tara:strand:- start:373 stop:594 length:222 start_codon:yes stop_codon:yes gene_type:complete